MQKRVLKPLKILTSILFMRNESIIPILCGIGITIGAFLIMGLFEISSDIIQLSTLLCVLGAILIFWNGEVLITRFQNRNHKRYINNIFLISDIKYYYGKNKKIFVATICIYFEIISYIAGVFILYPNGISNAIAYHPYHMMYCELDKSFKPLSNAEINSIVKNNGNATTKMDSIGFARDNGKTIFCVDDINRLIKKDYEVSRNSLIHVYPYYMNDGYEHNINSKIKSINIYSKKGIREFKLQHTIINPLLGEANCIADDIYLANKEDYKWIILNCNSYYIGKLHLYNFRDWHNSNMIIREVQNKLFMKNNVEKGDDFYKVSSRIEAYNTELKSANFAASSGTYMCLLLYFSAIVMIHFKLKMEYKDEKDKYLSLYRIGIKEIEIKKMIYQKIFIIYAIPFTYSIIISIGFSYFENSYYGYGALGILYDVITSIVFLVIHLLVYKFYSQKYYGRVIAELG